MQTDGADGGSSGDELLSPDDEVEEKIDEENEDDLLSAQVDEDFAAIKVLVSLDY